MTARILFSVLVLSIFATLSLNANDNLYNSEPEFATLKEFETDGCTLFIEGPTSKPDLWAHCCFEHDLRYWFGGTEEDKKHSDRELKACVKEVAGNFWANIIYSGVRVGHLSPVKFKYVWSWGWEPKRDKSTLSDLEIDYVIKKLFELDLDPQFREVFIQKYLNYGY